MDTAHTSYRASLVLLIVSGLFFFLNFAIGDTILANVIVLVLSFLTGILSLSVAALSLKHARNKAATVIVLTCASLIVLSICILFATDNVSVGYGP